MWIDNILIEIKTILDDNLPSKLSELEIEYDDEISLSVPIVYVYRRRFVRKKQAIYISAITTDIWQQLVSWALARHLIELTIWIMESKGEKRIQQKVYRYIRAVKEILKEEYTLDSNDMRLRIRNVNYISTYGKEKSFLQGATLTVDVLCDSIM